MPDHFEVRLWAAVSKVEEARSAVDENGDHDELKVMAARHRVAWTLEPSASEIAALVEAAREYAERVEAEAASVDPWLAPTIDTGIAAALIALDAEEGKVMQEPYRRGTATGSPRHGTEIPLGVEVELGGEE